MHLETNKELDHVISQISNNNVVNRFIIKKITDEFYKTVTTEAEFSLDISIDDYHLYTSDSSTMPNPIIRIIRFIFQKAIDSMLTESGLTTLMYLNDECSHYLRNITITVNLKNINRSFTNFNQFSRALDLLSHAKYRLIWPTVNDDSKKYADSAAVLQFVSTFFKYLSIYEITELDRKLIENTVRVYGVNHIADDNVRTTLSLLSI